MLGIASILLMVFGSIIGLFGGIILGAFFFGRGRSRARSKGHDRFTEAMWSNLEALCEHLKRIGLDVTIESKEEGGADLFGGTIGSVRVANRNIDLVELNRAGFLEGGEGGGMISKFWCVYVLQVKAKGLEDRQIVEGKPVTVRKGFLRRAVIGFEWKGKELAQTLNNDSNLRNYFISQRYPPDVVISIAPKGHQSSIRIFEKRSGHDSPRDAFPTIETFEAYDRIARHTRSIADTHA